MADISDTVEVHEHSGTQETNYFSTSNSVIAGSVALAGCAVIAYLLSRKRKRPPKQYYDASTSQQYE